MNIRVYTSFHAKGSSSPFPDLTHLSNICWVVVLFLLCCSLMLPFWCPYSPSKCSVKFCRYSAILFFIGLMSSSLLITSFRYFVSNIVQTSTLLIVDWILFVSCCVQYPNVSLRMAMWNLFYFCYSVFKSHLNCPTYCLTFSFLSFYKCLIINIHVTSKLKARFMF